MTTVFKALAVCTIFAGGFALVSQSGTMQNLHGDALISMDRQLSDIEPAAGGYEAETAEPDCVIKARGIGSLSSCD